MLPAGDSRMEWTLRLVGMGIDGQSRSFEVMAINRPDGLGDVAKLGLTLAEAKLLLAQVQQQVVAASARAEIAVPPDSPARHSPCHVSWHAGATRVARAHDTLWLILYHVWLESRARCAVLLAMAR